MSEKCNRGLGDFYFSVLLKWQTWEAVQSDGRADIVAKHPAIVCIFELKVDEPVDKAFAQIRGKGYAEPYRAGGVPVWLVGLSFDSKTRRLVDCAAMPL
jgi:hypothetical protein